VREHNVYRWAGNLVAELCDVRLDHPANGKAVLTTHAFAAKAPSREKGSALRPVV
jgi:hypothetical protein